MAGLGRWRTAIGFLAAAVVLAACSTPPAGPEPDVPAPVTPSSTTEPSGSETPPGTQETTPSATISETPGTSTGPETTSGAPSSVAWPPVTQPTVIASGLQSPWSIVFHGHTPLISERDTGRILQLAADGSTRVVGTVPGVVHAGEAGLLGLAIRGDDLYTYYTTADDNRVARFPLTIAGDGAITLGEPSALVTGLPHASIHNGGRLAFGPDGMLYATVGDAGDTGRAQRLDTLGGKILRMTPDGQVPPDNPFSGSLIYSYGHRNPQGLAWADDGTMFASEFGQSTWDELNIITPGSDYGWPVVEGIAGDDRYVDPVQQWSPAGASPSGITIEGGTIYIANLRGQRLREVPVADPSTSVERYVNEYGRLRAVTATPDGALWLLTNNTDGRGDPAPDDDRIIAIPAH